MKLIQPIAQPCTVRLGAHATRNFGAALAFLVLLATGLSPGPASAAENLLWQLGKPDNDDREFALAPGRYGQFREDGFFVVGKSDAKRDWPYAQPGPADTWAGGRQHTFTVMFGLQAAPTAGECKLRLDFVDTQGGAPPALHIAVNGTPIRPAPDRENFQLPAGAGDASIFGQPAKGKECKLDVPFPANVLRAGGNEIAITTVSGSWVLYDWLGLETPEGLTLAEASGTFVGSVHSLPALAERDGKLVQMVQFSVRHFGEPAEATVTVSGVSPMNLPLRSGAQNLEVPVPAVEREQPVTVSVTVAGKTLASQSVTLKPVRKWVVYLLPHSHVDIGYTHVQTDVEKAQWKYLEMAIGAARKSADYPAGSQFKWNTEVLWAVDSYLQQATPEQRADFIAAVKAGQVGLDALYGNMLTGLCRSEEFLRSLRLATVLTERTGVPIESAMITDVPGYTWGVVPAFAHSGVKYFSIGPNGGDRIGHTIAAWGDKPFWWIGPNGKDKVLVWMTGTGYYRVFSSAENLMNYLGQLDAKGYPYDFVQVRHCLGDNGAPDVDFADTVKQWNEAHAYPKLVIATTAQMFRDFEQRYGDKIPTAQGDFTPYWEDGAASSALETALNRAAAERLVQAEAMFAMFNPKAYPLRGFYQAWRNTILYDEHTWGAHNSISQPDAPFVKSQWAIKRQFALDADAQSRALLAEADAARGKPITLSPTGGEGRGEGATSASPALSRIQAIDVINTTGASYPYGLVTIPKELSTAGDAISYSPTNRSGGTSQRLSTGELIFRPCVGNYIAHRWYVTGDKAEPLRESFPAARAQGATLTSGKSAVGHGLTLRLDEQTGSIASLIYDSHELVDPKSQTRLNDYFYLPGSDLKGLQRNGPVKISVKENGPLLASLLVESEAPGCRKLTREYRLHALRNYVEIINTVDKAPVRAKEGVHFGFGFNVPGGVVRTDVPWGVVLPEADQIPGACKNWFTVQRFVDISNDKFGVTWLTPDAPLVEVGGVTANLIGSLSNPRNWLDHLEPSQTLFSWAMNNHWHTNYRAEQEGPTVFRYFIIPHDSPFDGAKASHVAMEMAQPLVAVAARGDLSARHHPVLSSGEVTVSAFKPSDDGKALIVRLFGSSGKDAKTKLEWPATTKPTAVWLSDNSERPLRPAPDTLEIPAWTIVTVRAEMP